MSSSYPAGIDAFSTAHGDNVNEVVHASTINDLADAVNKIETELGTLPKGVSADVKTRIAATETVANAAVPKSTVTTAGDLIYATGSSAVTRLAIGASGTVLKGGSSAPTWASIVDADVSGAAAIAGFKLATGLTGPPGSEVDYKEQTSDVTFTATTFAGATTLLTGNAVTYDGSTAVLVQVYTPRLVTPSNTPVFLTLWDGSTDLGIIAKFGTAAGGVTEGPVTATRKITPSAAAHTFSVRGVCNAAGTGTFGGGVGGTGGTFLPSYIRITKA